MNRLTKLSGDKYISKLVIDNQNDTFSGEVIDKLANFENLFDYLIKEQEAIPKKLEALRNENKSKSYHFRELFGKKLTVEAFLNLMKDYGIES